MRGCAVSSNGIFLFRRKDGKEEGEKLGICSVSWFGSKTVPHLEMNFPHKSRGGKRGLGQICCLPSLTYVD